MRISGHANQPKEFCPRHVIQAGVSDPPPRGAFMQSPVGSSRPADPDGGPGGGEGPSPGADGLPAVTHGIPDATNPTPLSISGWFSLLYNEPRVFPQSIGSPLAIRRLYGFFLSSSALSFSGKKKTSHSLCPDNQDGMQSGSYETKEAKLTKPRHTGMLVEQSRAVHLHFWEYFWKHVNFWNDFWYPFQKVKHAFLDCDSVRCLAVGRPSRLRVVLKWRSLAKKEHPVPYFSSQHIHEKYTGKIAGKWPCFGNTTSMLFAQGLPCGAVPGSGIACMAFASQNTHASASVPLLFESPLFEPPKR